MPTPVALTNYTLKSNQGFNGSSWDNCSKWWPGDGGASSMPEQAAWICNQFDDCDGFSSATDPNNKSWVNFYFKSWNGGKGIYSSGFHNDNSRNTYTKNGAWSRKAYNPDYNDPSILQSPASKILFNNGTTFGTNKVGVSGAQGSNNIYTANWGSGNTQNPDYGCCNNIHDVNVPLGWRFFVGDNGTMAGCNGGAAAYFNQGDGQWHHIADGAWDDGILVENTGFDVFAHWDDMSTKGVVAADELLIKRKWCGIQSPSQLVANKTKCTGPTSSGTRVLSDTDWATYLTNACLADTNNNWANQPAVIDEMKTLYLGNQDSQGHIQALFKTFCRGDPLNPKSTGGHRTDVRCAAINADDFGVLPGTSNCFDAANSSFPGCAMAEIDGVPYIGLVDLLSPLFSLPPGPLGTAINSANTNPGCLIQAGRLATTNGADNTFPYQQTVCNPPNLQICGINVSVGAAQNSPIDASCNQTMINNAPPGSPGAAPPPGSPGAAPPPGSPGAAPPLPIPALSNIGLDTPDKQYGGIGGCICLICICFIMIIVLAMSGGGDEGGGSTAALLASLGAAGG